MDKIIEVNFGEYSQGDDRPLPFIVADRWQFPLAWHIVEEQQDIYYSPEDWIKGALGTQDAEAAWQSVKNSAGDRLSELVIQLPYISSNGRAYHADFVPDFGLYLTVQYLKTSKKRAVLDEIKQFLAKAGAFADIARIDPEAAELALAASRTRKFQRMGRDEGWIQMRNFSVFTRKQFTDYIQKILGNKAPFGIITNDVYRGVLKKDAEGLKNKLDLPPNANPRDHLGRLQLAYIVAAEESCQIALQDYEENQILLVETVRTVVQNIANLVGIQASEMAEKLKIDLITGRPLLAPGDVAG